MNMVTYIASCPEHGLHGARGECYTCGGPVDRVPMVRASEVYGVVRRAADTTSALQDAARAMVVARGHLTPAMRAGTAQACQVLDDAQVRARRRLEQVYADDRAATIGVLTEAQLRVAALVARGMTNVEVAAELHYATQTVKWHLSSIYKAIGVRGRAELARWWIYEVELAGTLSPRKID